ncbi:C2H2-type zinc finger protein [Cardinium endosymbiont of Nabis limbatus]|uniref:C2H2-type zinc finger protein n=1 Tax=Cardinium endosymbiont of Nabis limbatus TaxID=3066217 RepID=UPI003AF3CAAE
MICFIYACSSIARLHSNDEADMLTYGNGLAKETCQNSQTLDSSTVDKFFLLAAKNGDVAFIKQALAQGMRLDELQNIIHAQGCFCHKELVRYLSSMYNPTDQYGNTVLHAEGKKGNIFSFFRFLEFYRNRPLLHQYKTILANLDIQNNAGQTLFYLLAKEDHVLFAQVILDKLNQLASLIEVNLDQDINSFLSIKNNDGLTVMAIAAIKRCKDFVELVSPYVKPYTCGACPQRFRFPSTLISHERTHTGERPFKCAQCGKGFTKAHHLQAHMSVHTGERPHKCDQCSDKFRTSSNLKRHQLIHTKRKPYECSMCDQAFNQKCNLTAHEQAIHGNQLLNKLHDLAYVEME